MARLCLLTLALAAASASAHDTWFERLPGSGAAGTVLALGTGAQFPVLESPIGAEYLPRRGCQGADGAALALDAADLLPTALRLQAPAPATDCWAQSTAFALTLEPALVPVYLREVRPPQAVLDLWAARQARGLPWKERYSKHARIALQPGPMAPVGLALEALVVSQDDSEMVLQVLRDGQPLAGLAVELRHERTSLGLWRRTDADGRVRLRSTLPGAWLLRAVDLRPSATEPDGWDSRFVTLAFAVQNGSSLTSSSRSASQTAANAAISNEPATSTPR